MLAFVAPVLLADVAQAYYTPGLGRFISRDPIGMWDGPNEYAYVRNQVTIAFDPLGLWKVDRAGAHQADATADQGDTIKSLSDIIGLDESEWRAWIEFSNLRTVVGIVRSPAQHHPRFNSSTEICPDEKVRIPNTVIPYWGGELGGFGQFWVMWEQDKATLDRRGFAVFNLANNVASEFESWLDKEEKAKNLHGIIAWGHGEPGAYYTDADGMRGADWQYYRSPYDHWHPRYKMALGVIWACYSSTARGAFSDKAIFWGSDDVLVPHGFHLFGPTIDKLVPPGAQGTRK